MDFFDLASGDYHDNISFDIFMQWLRNRLIPVFKRNFPGKKMILILDNAPYNHKYIIVSLSKVNSVQAACRMAYRNANKLYKYFLYSDMVQRYCVNRTSFV